MDKVTPKTDVVDGIIIPEWPEFLTFQWTGADRKPCQLIVISNRGRSHTIMPGNCGGPDEFLILWSKAVRFGTDPSAAQDVWDAVPDPSFEQEVAIAEAAMMAAAEERVAAAEAAMMDALGDE